MNTRAHMHTRARTIDQYPLAQTFERVEFDTRVPPPLEYSFAITLSKLERSAFSARATPGISAR